MGCVYNCATHVQLTLLTCVPSLGSSCSTDDIIINAVANPATGKPVYSTGKSLTAPPGFLGAFVTGSIPDSVRHNFFIN